MPDVLFDARSASLPRTTGWERYTRELASQFAGDPNIEVRQGVADQRGRLLEDWLRLPSAIRGRRVAHFPSLPPSPMARGARVVYTLHDLTWWRYPETASRGGRHYYRRLAAAALQRVHVVTDSESVRCELLADFGVDAGRVTTIPLGVSALPEPAGRSDRRRPYLLTVGTLEPRKNLERLVEAFGRSGLAGDLDLVVVGRPGWGRPPDGVDVIGAVTDGQLSTLYSHATGMVLASLYEGFGLPVVEAMRAGVPVACSDIPVFREVSGGHAVFFDPLSTESVAQGLRILVETGCAQVAGARSWSERFTWKATADQLRALYRSLC